MPEDVFKTKDEIVGERVRKYQEKHAQYVRKMYPTWLAEGAKLKDVRLDMRVSQEELSREMNVDVSVVQRLEQGLRRRAIKFSYKNTLELIMYRRFAQVQRL